ncbi:ankyrin repeat domain-containing protein [Candidatus Dependentiae bacterium]|nr:ankyrin repeat domain-containing protein [Candidatus Dependentiae bacterium]
MKRIFYFIASLLFLISNSYGMNSDSINKSAQELIRAIKAGNVQEVEALCGNTRIINLRYSYKDDMADGITALHIAVLFGHTEIVELLIKAGANVTVLTKNNKNIFFYAVPQDNKEILELLLRAHERANSKIGYNEFTLRWAIESNYKTIVELLLEAHVEFQATDGITALHLAASNDRCEIMEMLIEAGADVNAEDQKSITPLMLAAEDGHKNAVQILVQHKADIEAQAKKHDNSNALQLAAGNGHKEVVELLLQSGARINEQGPRNNTAVQLAAQMKHKDVVILLLQSGADVKTYTVGVDSTLLHWAAEHGWSDIADLLLKKGVDSDIKNSNKVTPLHMAAYNGHSRVVELLLNNKADSNAQAIDGNRPIECAVNQGHRLIVEILLAFKAQIPRSVLFNKVLAQAKSNQGQLSTARSFKSIADLLSRGAFMPAFIKVQVDLKRQELLQAVKQDDVVKVTELLKEGFSLNTCGKDDNTLLHLAIAHNSQQVLELLLSLYSADDNKKLWSKRNTLGVAPVEAAVAAGNVELLKKLLDSKLTESDKALKEDTPDNQE